MMLFFDGTYLFRDIALLITYSCSIVSCTLRGK